MTHVPCDLAMEALADLLNEFRQGNIVALSAEVKGMERHACHLAARLPHVTVIAADIYPRCFQAYRVLRLGRLPGNFSFVKDNIFASRLDVQPTAVVFFGACGAVSDGALDYAIASGARHVMCRTCCHDNIGGNVTITARPNPVNRIFRFKNWVFDRVRKAPKYTGHYFSPSYSPSAYPRSAAGRHLSTADEFMDEGGSSSYCRRHLFWLGQVYGSQLLLFDLA